MAYAKGGVALNSITFNREIFYYLILLIFGTLDCQALEIPGFIENQETRPNAATEILYFEKCLTLKVLMYNVHM